MAGARKLVDVDDDGEEEPITNANGLNMVGEGKDHSAVNFYIRGTRIHVIIFAL